MLGAMCTFFFASTTPGRRAALRRSARHARARGDGAGPQAQARVRAPVRKLKTRSSQKRTSTAVSNAWKPDGRQSPAALSALESPLARPPQEGGWNAMRHGTITDTYST